MISNLFSIFDPASSYLSCCWFILFLILLVLSNQLWVSKTSFSSMLQNALSFLHNEISFTLSSQNNSEITIIMALFILILLINGVALFPQIFSTSSHLTITLPLAMTSWLLINLFGWWNNTNHILAHLVPQGTPVALISFIVLIELTSSIIRPITLCVRLTANIIAGHLLLTLLGNAIITMNAYFSITLLIAPLILTILETAVAVIQSYVFMTLITLYTTEVN